MPPRVPPRQAFALQDEGHHAGWRDVTGGHFRPGRDVYCWVAYTWGKCAGRVPARLVRNYGWEGDKLGDFRQNVEIITTMDYAMLLEIASLDVLEEKLGTDVCAFMQANQETVFVEVDWGEVLLFESVLTDAEVFLIRRGAGGERRT